LPHKLARRPAGELMPHFSIGGAVVDQRSFVTVTT
jgi:hypothetical protein